MRCAFCTASARLRAPSLLVQRRGVLLDRVRRQEQRSAISRFVAPDATGSSTSRSRSVSGGPAGASCGRNTVMPRPTMRTAPAMSAAGQSLEMNPAAPAARAALGRDAAGAGDHQHVGRRRLAQALAISAPIWPTNSARARRAARSAASWRRPPRCCARSGSAPPTAARRASAAAPSARPRGRRRPARAAGARSSTAHWPAGPGSRPGMLTPAPPDARATCPSRACRTRRCHRPAAPRAPRA